MDDPQRSVAYSPVRMGTHSSAANGELVLRGRPAESPAGLGSALGKTLARTLEFLLTAFLLIVSSPLLLTVALLIRFSGRGPVLFQQERVGRNGKTFQMIKFRTMRLDAERETGPIWATKGDPRCTRIGGWLRRLSIDELPQLINVLRGEMSLVGPRPERPFFVRKFSHDLPGYEKRHAVRPGITGWAQVHGWRGDTELRQRLEHDLYYVQHQSLKLDTYILLLTPIAMLRAKNAC